jgi:hypothetical protein
MNIRLLAAYQLGYHGRKEDICEQFHEHEPHMAGWYAAASYLRELASDRWRKEHPDDISGFGYLDRHRELLPEESAARQLTQRYWLSVARLAGFDAVPTDEEVAALITELGR